MATETKKVAPAKKNQEEQQPRFPLEKINFIMIAVCIVLIVFGFILMMGSSNDTTTWNPDIFNSTRTVVGPLISLAGFVLMIFAIMYKKKDNKPSEELQD